MDPADFHLRKMEGYPCPATTINARPVINSKNIIPNSQLTVLLAPLNSFQMKTPQIAAIIGAPCPSAYETAGPATSAAI